MLAQSDKGRLIMRRMLIGLAVAFVALPSSAQVSSDEWERCRGLDSGAGISATARAGYCTKLIDGGKVASGALPYAYTNRGLTYEQLGARDKAIADYRAALTLRPNMKLALDALQRLGATP
jgi:tetratricopeptide (TPR) repeat protein